MSKAKADEGKIKPSLVPTEIIRGRAMRLIDADALKKALIECTPYVIDPVYRNINSNIDIFTAMEILDELPTIDAVPVVRGEWKLYGNDDDSGMSYWCTVCNFQLSEDLFYSGYKNGRWIENGVFKYCPNCGAKMEVEP